MTHTQQIAIQRFKWLCQELIAGNQFSPEQLEKWIFLAEQALKNDATIGGSSKTADDPSIRINWSSR